MRSQVGLKKHHYEQSWWSWWNSSWGISNPGRWCCESAALNMPANLEKSAVARGLEKVSFHPNPKERQCQRMHKLPHNCTHLIIALFTSKVKVRVKSLSLVWLCDPIDSTQEYYSRLPFPSPGDLPDQGIEPQSPALQAGTLLSELPGKSIGRLA